MQFEHRVPPHPGPAAIELRTALGPFGHAFPDPPLTLPSPREGRGIIARRFCCASYLVTGRSWFPLLSRGEGRVRGGSMANGQKRHDVILNSMAVHPGPLH